MAASKQSIIETKMKQVKADGVMVFNKTMHDRLDPFHSQSQFVYDSLWLAAISGSKAKASQRPVKLKDITEIVFEGLTGTVRILENGDRSRDGLFYAVHNFVTEAGTGRMTTREIGFWTTELGFLWTATPVWPGSIEGWQHVPNGMSLCEPGYFLEAGFECAQCPDGTYSEGKTCIACGLGTVAAKPGSARCTPCSEIQPGTYADGIGLSECASCPLNSAVPPYSPVLYPSHCAEQNCLLCLCTDLAASQVCARVPFDWGRGGIHCLLSRIENLWACAWSSHTCFRLAQAANISDCECRFGYYREDFNDELHQTACNLCPAGATCFGGDNHPFPNRGYWGDKNCTAYGGSVECGDRWDLFFACDEPQTCIGGSNFSCSEGRGGKKCLQLQIGFFQIAGVSLPRFRKRFLASSTCIRAHILRQSPLPLLLHSSPCGSGH